MRLKIAVALGEGGGIDAELREFFCDAARNSSCRCRGRGRSRGFASSRRKAEAEVLAEGEDVAAPAGADGGGAEGVFEDEVPADDPGEDFAERGVAVGVGGAGDGDHGGELGVAEAGEDAADARDDEGEHHAGAGVARGGRAGEHEDASADDGADARAEMRLTGAERALRGCARRFRLASPQDVVERLGYEQIRHALYRSP